jgi:hypothetical protein
MTNKSKHSNPNPKKKLFPSTKKGKFSEETVRTTDKKSNKCCLIHGQCAHNSNECTLLKDQARKMKATYNAQGNRYDKNRFKKAQEANQAASLKAALKGLMKPSANNRTTKSMCSKISSNTTSISVTAEQIRLEAGQEPCNACDSEEANSCNHVDHHLDRYVNEHYLLANTVRRPENKRAKLKHDESDTTSPRIVFVHVNNRRGKTKFCPVKEALLDSGASTTVLSTSIAKKLKIKTVPTTTQWSTVG